MVDIPLISTDLILLILLLLPGLLGLKLHLIRADRIDNYSRLDAVAYSIGISILSVLILYIVYGVYLHRPPTFVDVQISSLPLIISLYLSHISVSTLLGEVSGRIVNWQFSDGRNTTRKEIWDYTFDEIYSDSRVRVFTTDSSEIEGTVVKAGQSLQARDLILASPYELIDTENDEDKKAISLGDYVYIHEEAVSYIGFFEDLNDDLDLQVLKQLGYAPIEPESREQSDKEEPDEELEKELQQELREGTET